MKSTTVELRNIEGTEAAAGWAGDHTLVVDRPEGKAGGQGLGFNGGQLLALALGGCFCNDLRYVAADGREAGNDCGLRHARHGGASPAGYESHAERQLRNARRL
jgi:uncharacterized OsmC-like protein